MKITYTTKIETVSKKTELKKYFLIKPVFYEIQNTINSAKGLQYYNIIMSQKILIRIDEGMR